MGGIRRAGYALAVSATVHALILFVLSLIAMSVTSDTNPLITMLIDRTDGSSLQQPFEDLPDIEVKPESKSSPPRSEAPAEKLLTESQPEISDALFQNAAPATEAATASGDANAAEVSAIQGRVTQAGGKKGEVQFALAWTDRNDIDMHVIVPSGERISYQHKRSRCQGELDVDMNVNGESDQPVENVRWLPRKAPSGRYTILINLFQVHDPAFRQTGRSDFRLLASLGTESQIVTDFVAGGRSVVVHRFVYVPDSVRGRRRQIMLDRFAKMQKIDEERAQEVLRRARAERGERRQEKLREVSGTYPHTDAAIEALKMMSGVTNKS